MVRQSPPQHEGVESFIIHYYCHNPVLQTVQAELFLNHVVDFYNVYIIPMNIEALGVNIIYIYCSLYQSLITKI